MTRAARVAWLEAKIADYQAELALHRSRLRSPHVDGSGPARPDWVTAWLAGESLTSVGERHGVTRERARQVVTAQGGALVGLHKHRRAARKRLQHFVEYGYACQVCGQWFDNGRTAFCTPEHQHIEVLLRYATDPDFRAKHGLTVARKNGSPVHLANMQNGTVKSQGTWFTQGSKALGAAVLAYRSGWPIFDRLDERKQEQVIAVANGRQWATRRNELVPCALEGCQEMARPGVRSCSVEHGNLLRALNGAATKAHRLEDAS